MADVDVGQRGNGDVHPLAAWTQCRAPRSATGRGLPDGHSRATTTDPGDPPPAPRPPAEPADLTVLLARRDRLATPVAHRDLATYQAVAHAAPPMVAAVLPITHR